MVGRSTGSLDVMPSGWIAIIVGMFVGVLLVFPTVGFLCQLDTFQRSGACGHNVGGLVVIAFPVCWAFCALLIYRLIRATEKEASKGTGHDV